MTTRRRSKSDIYLHFVWATRSREPMIGDDLQRPLYRFIEGTARGLGCEVLALNGMPDHVHLLVRVPARLSAAEIAKQVKGSSSRFANEFMPEYEKFRWQPAYGVFSVSRSHVKRVVAYVEQQQRHHAAGTVWVEWEEDDEPDPD